MPASPLKWLSRLWNLQGLDEAVRDARSMMLVSPCICVCTWSCLSGILLTSASRLTGRDWQMVDVPSLLHPFPLALRCPSALGPLLPQRSPVLSPLPLSSPPSPVSPPTLNLPHFSLPPFRLVCLAPLSSPRPSAGGSVRCWISFLPAPRPSLPTRHAALCQLD